MNRRRPGGTIASIFPGLVAVFFLSQGPAAQDAVTYTFVTGDEPFGSALAGHFVGQSVSGLFTYDNSAPLTGMSGNPPTVGSSVYAGGMTNLFGSVAGMMFLDPVGRVTVGDDRYSTPPVPADILVLAGDPSLASSSPPEEFDFQGFAIDGFTLVNVRLFWIEDVQGAPDFLPNQELPVALPGFYGRLALDFVETGTSGPLASVFFDLLSVSPSSLWVSIDIKPGDATNAVNPFSRGNLAVAILTTDSFDALQVDPLSVAFGVSGAAESHGRGHIADVDADGDADLVLHFRIQESGIQCDDLTTMLTGQTFDGQLVMGVDDIRTVGCRQGSSAAPSMASTRSP